MKTALALSVALNLVLAFTVLTHGPQPPPPATANPGSVAARTAPRAALTAAGDHGWTSWLAPLRAAGVPPEVIADLVRADFDRRWQARERELQDRYRRGELDADGLALAALDHDRLLEREWQVALGDEDYRAWDLRRTLDGFRLDAAALSGRERLGLYEIQRQLRETLRQEQSERLRGTIDQATLTEREQRAQDEADVRTRALLGESRAAQLSGTDDTAGRLRRALADHCPTEAQLAALAEAERRWDDARNRLVTQQVNTADPGLAAALAHNDAQRRDDFERIAGPGAFDEYLRAADSRYAELQRHAGAWGLSPADAAETMSALQNYEAAVREYERDAEQRGLDPVSARLAIAGYQQRVSAELEARLGAATYATLQRNGLTPAPVSTSAVP